MASTNTALAVTTRSGTGTTASAALRRAGQVPGNLFGHGSKATAVAIDAKAFDELLHAGGKNHLLEITLDGAGRDTALVREVQRHPITRRVLHADLQRVRATEEIEASLPLATIGVPDGVRNQGGVMDVVLHTLDVRGPANGLPEQIEISVEHLGVHDKLLAGDVVLPAGLKLATEATTILITVEPSKIEAQAAEDEAAVAVDAPAPAQDAPAEASTADG
jgi:large subunit ribosomal protein L25